MAKSTVFVKLFSFALALIGVIFIVFTIALFAEFKLHLLSFASEKIPSFAYTVLALGTISLMSSGFGCMGAAMKNKPLLGLNCILNLVLIGLQVCFRPTYLACQPQQPCKL